MNNLQLRTHLPTLLFVSTALLSNPGTGTAALAATSAPSSIPARLQAFIGKEVIAGAVALVAQRDRIQSVHSVGYSDLASRRPARLDDLYWIASMTKPMTATTVMMLQDEGRLSIDDPVEKYLPEFRGQWQVHEKSSDTVTLVRPSRPITLRDLLTHTSGLSDVPSPRATATLAELVMGYSQQPLRFPPGSRWEYSNAGINTLGRIVEVVSGQDFATFLHRRLLLPLRMRDTTFWPSASQIRRLAKSYQPATNGHGLVETEISFLKGAPLSDRTRTPFPAGGLFSTAQDVARFHQLFLNAGRWQRQQLLSPSAVNMMTRTQTGDIKTGFVDGMSFGLGFAVVKEPIGVTSLLSQGTFGHGGAYGTQSWADPKKELVLVLMIQRAKLPNADASEVRRAFQEAALAEDIDRTR